ncbi:MAG: outer membrane beta-barrel protein [Bacteroidetes bacterium]|nr:outer membrane beta-barrel protein [Bacteroidota bacterium]
MKKCIFYFIFIFISCHVFAQEHGFGYGTILGIGQNTIKCDGLNGATPKVGFTAGMATSYKFNKMFGLSLDITGVTKGVKAKGSEVTFPSQTHNYQENYTFIDLDIPVMAKLYLGSDRINLNAMGGVGMNFNLVAISSRTYDESDYNSDNGYSGKQLQDINPTNLSYTAGVGITAKSAENYYFIHLRLTGPLSELGKINGNTAFHSNFNITFGYLFY